MKAMDSPYLLNELRPPLKNSVSFSTTVETAARKERSKPEENLFPLPACKQNNSALSKINHAHIRLEGSIFYLGGDLGAGEGRLWQKIMFKYRAVSKKGTIMKSKESSKKSITLFLGCCLKQVKGRGR